MQISDSDQTSGQSALFTSSLTSLLEGLGMDRAALEGLLVDVASRRTRGPGSGEPGAIVLELAWTRDPRQVPIGPSSLWDLAAVAALRVAIFATTHTWRGLALDSGCGNTFTTLRGPHVADAREMDRKIGAHLGAE